ncbi:hypothetical protein BDY24DRAFT_412380 [Mrakia frigida]|uniref:uncharacterized protein n=1 Tax=Mrakia frigida TaxID=29902 RepID=UPI003FCBF386
MSSLTPTFSFEPLPFYVPIEIKLHILRFCDLSTLVKVARVSLAFLELSSPLLYRDVRIQGVYRLQRLFCKRIDPQPRVTPFLSLSRIEAFHFIVLPYDRYFDHIDNMDRVSSPDFLVVRCLTITDD